MWRRWFKKGRDDDKNIVRTQAGGETTFYTGSYGELEFGDSTAGVKEVLDLLGSHNMFQPFLRFW
jgi:hypothetical protein